MVRYKNISSLLIRTSCAAVAVIFAYSSLYILGNIGEIIPYVDNSIIPSVKLGILLFLVLMFVTASYYYLIISFLKALNGTSVPKIALLAVTCLLGAFLAIIIGGGLYIKLGDYLRDVHGINWYFMDASGWDGTKIIALTPIFSAAIYFAIMKLLRKD